jgi:hypothetical protein
MLEKFVDINFQAKPESINREAWTYGAEHELADYDRKNVTLPVGFSLNHKDHTIVNSTGVANDPHDKLHWFGGEINTRPTDTPEEQVVDFEKLLKAIPDAKVNYRSNLHIHIRVPGLQHDLTALKRIQRYIHAHMRRLFEVIQPIAEPSRLQFDSDQAFQGALVRYERMLRSHHTLLPEEKLQHQLGATECKQFFARGVPTSKKGRPLWHLQPRECVNLRQLLDTDTIEFRHFFGTLDPKLLLNAIHYCADFLAYALTDAPV